MTNNNKKTQLSLNIIEQQFNDFTTLFMTMDDIQLIEYFAKNFPLFNKQESCDFRLTDRINVAEHSVELHYHLNKESKPVIIVSVGIGRQETKSFTIN